jgi:SAM-dependent methyltransferase
MLKLPTKILPKTLLNAVKRTRPIYSAGRKARFALGSRMGARFVPGLDGRAHFNDFMLTSVEPDHVASYRRGAVEFVDILGRALREAARTWASVEACLEIGCGYGRIVRELRQTLPAKAISVCDVMDEGAKFTASEFGVRKIPVVEQIDASRDGSFDLIYLLSVYTHLRRDLIEANLGKVAALLKSGGVAVFTIHGTRSAAKAEIYDQYWLDKDKLNTELTRTGFYYERYPYYYAEYGLTWIAEDAVKAMVAAIAPELEFVAYRPTAVDGHQDVFVYKKR